MSARLRLHSVDLHGLSHGTQAALVLLEDQQLSHWVLPDDALLLSLRYHHLDQLPPWPGRYGPLGAQQHRVGARQRQVVCVQVNDGVLDLVL